MRQAAVAIASASIPDTLSQLEVNPDVGLTRAEMEARRHELGYNEVAERKAYPVLKFLGKFWGISAWMLELIIVLSAALGKYSDLAVVSAFFLWFGWSGFGLATHDDALYTFSFLLLLYFAVFHRVSPRLYGRFGVRVLMRFLAGQRWRMSTVYRNWSRQ